MPTPKTSEAASTAILLLAEIKAAVEAFDRGDANAFDVVDAVIQAVTEYRVSAEFPRSAA